ncbi:hypothetical protein MJH54_30085, partial [Salmonella enterica subsp. enterica serovar Montevideo]|nr:hypothetical protein [Salmonella enterica subsp. enterica serovar Montevideo]
REVDEIRQIIGADGLIFQDLNDLIEAVRAENPDIQQFECSVFIPGIVLHGHVFANRLKVHQRHDASENRFCRAGKNVYDQVSAKR